MIYPFCFPIVYHGLIAGHTRKSQYETVNLLFRGKFVGDRYGNGSSEDIDRPEISKYVNGKMSVNNDLVSSVLSKSAEIPGRVTSLDLDPDMEFIVSAFHVHITMKSRLNKVEKEHFENIIFVDNDWVKYITEALLISLPYAATVEKIMTKDFVQDLHNLHFRDGVENLFRLKKNERLHYQIERGIPEEITDEVLRDIWRKVLIAEKDKPGSVSAKTYSVLEKLTPQEACAFMLVSSTFLNQLMADVYFLLDTSRFKINVLEDWLFDMSHVVPILQECGLIRNDVYEYYDASGNKGAVILSNRNYNVAIRAFIPEGGAGERIYQRVINLTEAGNDLCNILDLKPDNAFLFAVAYALNLEYEGKIDFEVLPYTREDYDRMTATNDKSQNLLKDFSIDKALADAKEKAFPQIIHIITGYDPC